MAGKENKPTKTTLNVTFLVSTGFTGAGMPAGLASLCLTPRHMYCCILASLPYACKPDKQLQAGGQALTACQISSAQGGSVWCCFTLLPPCDKGKYIYTYRHSHATFAKTVAATTLLLREKEKQSFFTSAAKLTLSLAPPQEEWGSRGAATTWPQKLFKQIWVACNFYFLSSRNFLLELTVLGAWDGCALSGKLEDLLGWQEKYSMLLC